MATEIMTVRGPAQVEELGFTLPDEHVIIDLSHARAAGSAKRSDQS